MAREQINLRQIEVIKALGKKMFTYLKQQDEREPEYVETKD